MEDEGEGGGKEKEEEDGQAEQSCNDHHLLVASPPTMRPSSIISEKISSTAEKNHTHTQIIYIYMYVLVYILNSEYRKMHKMSKTDSARHTELC